MNKNEIIEKVKEMLFSTKVEDTFAEAKLDNGKLVSVPGDSFEVGSEIFVVGDGGEELPAPDGEHMLEDGTEVVVAEGKISEIKPVDGLEEDTEEEEEVQEEVLSTDVETETEKEEVETELEDVKEEDVVEEEEMEDKEDLKSRIDATEARLAALEELLKSKMSDDEETKTELSNVKEATVFLAEEFSKTPGGEKIEVKKSGFEAKFNKSATREAKLMDLMKRINEN